MNSLLITGNIIKRAFRNKKELLFLTLLPILIVGMMTILSEQQGTQISEVGYVNLDNGELGASLIEHLMNQENITLIAMKENDILNASANKKFSFSLLIPEDFSKQIRENQETKISFYPNESSLIYESFKERVNRYITSLYVIHRYADAGVIPDFSSRLETPHIKASYHIVNTEEQSQFEGRLPSMGFVIIFIMMLIFLTMGTLLEDKRKLTLARIFSQPIKEWEVVTGNLLGSLVLGLLQLIPILITLKIVFNIPWGMQFIGLSLILIAFLLATIGIGIGIAGIIKNKFNPFLIISTVIIPTSILGGAFIPASMLPDFMNKIGYIVPQKWVMEALEKILRGEHLSAVLLNIGVILMFGLAFATFGTKTLKPLDD